VKTSVDRIDATQVKLTVEVPFDELKPSVDKAIQEISDTVQIPGFRKGHVPARIVEQRVGRPAIMQEAVNDALPDFYSQAVESEKLRPVTQPQVEVSDIPGLNGDEGELVFSADLVVRPEIELPDLSTIEITIEEPTVDEDAVQVRLDQLRERFGTLKGVDRPAADGDFTSIDLTATIGDEEIDSVSGVSYQIGEGNMMEGLDEALISLSADEETTFEAPLAGGEHAGETAQVRVKLLSVKERELPEADDEFAQLASEFDTLDELKDDLRAQAEQDAEGNRVVLARDALLAKLMETLDVPVPAAMLDQEVLSHLENEGKPADDPHGEEIRPELETAIRQQFVLDVVAESREIGVAQDELLEYLVQTSQQYGMQPNQFISMLDQSGQIPSMVAEVGRAKALEVMLGEVTVKNAAGEVVDLGIEAEESDEDAVETNAKAAAAAAPAQNEASSDESAAPAATESAEELLKLSKAELVERAEAAGVAKSGTKAELVERLTAGA
jgi:trigger factor